MVIIYYLIATIIAVVLLYYFIYNKSVTNNENFQSFKIDESKMLNENSVRFSKDTPYNDGRTVFVFKDVNYLVQNKDNIFKYYKFDKKIIDYFDKNYTLATSDLTSQDDESINNASINNTSINNLVTDKLNKSSNSTEVGFGIDTQTNTSKIYILNKTTIKALKIKSGKEINSLYTLDNEFNLDKLNKFVGVDNGNKVNKYINTIMVDKNKDINMLDTNSQLLVQIIGNDNYNKYKQTLLENNKSKTNKPLEINKLNCYKRYDGDKFIGYHLDLSEYNLVIGTNKPFIKNMLADLGYNSDGIDAWINKHKDNIITILSFTKINEVDNITMYYTNVEDYASNNS